MTTVNRKYKDSLFCSIFKEKKDLLSLYNAVNRTDYTEEENLTVNTLENAIYMTMKNDVSFLIYGVLNLYEHQSTWNPNMPLRDLLYIVKQIKILIEKNKYDLYSSRQILIPTPQAVVFYNGKQDVPERQVLRLSDSFENKEKKGCLELECLVLNINYGKNKDLMDNCQKLMDYAKLIGKIRYYENRKSNLESAVDCAIEECIREGVLADYLRQNQSEVKELVLYEYDEQRHIENEKKISKEEGREEGREEGIKEGIKEGQEKYARLISLLLIDNRVEDMNRSLTDTEFRNILLKEYNLI